MPAVIFALVVPTALVAVAEAELPAWLDSVSRVGVVGLLFLALFGLHNRRWWVPAWAYRDLLERHERLRNRLDKVVDLAVRSTRSAERQTSLLNEALERGREAADERGQ